MRNHLVKYCSIYEMNGKVLLNQMKTITMQFLVFPDIFYIFSLFSILYLSANTKRITYSFRKGYQYWNSIFRWRYF